jgi:microcystin-dependent protein
MADQFVGEIRIFPFNFAPQGWALCQGQLLPIAQNTALFSLLGTNYGGNGTTNFALPNLNATAAAHAGNGAGLTALSIGERDSPGAGARALPSALTVARNMLASTSTSQAAAPLPSEPGLGINYCIALQGIFPPRS